MNSLRTDILQRAHHIGWRIQIPVGASNTELQKWLKQVEEQETYCAQRDELLLKAEKFGIQVSKPQVPISNRWIMRLSEKIENQEYYEVKIEQIRREIPFWVSLQIPNPPYDANQISWFLAQTNPLQRKWLKIRNITKIGLSLLTISSVSLFFFNWQTEIELQRQQQLENVEKLHREAQSYGIFVQKPMEDTEFGFSFILAKIGCISPELNTEQIKELEQLVIEQRSLQIQWKKIQEEMYRHGIDIPSALQTLYVDASFKESKKVRLNASILEEQKKVLQCHKNFPVLCKNQFQPSCLMSTSPLLVSPYEVTQGLFYEVMGYNPAERSDCNTQNGEEYPIVCIEWEETIAFVNQLSRRESLEPCYTIISPEEQNSKGPSIIHWRSNQFCEGYRLPTDEEWKKFALNNMELESSSQQKSSKNEIIFAGARGVENSCAVGNFKDSIHCNDRIGGISRVGLFQEYNKLYDVSGNVWEWVWDYYDFGMGSGMATNQETGQKVIRGGSFSSAPVLSSLREIRGLDMDSYRSDVGFRFVRSVHDCPTESD